MESLAALTTSTTPSLILVFLAGLLSFFSPCIIPVLPLYMSYLATGAKTTTEENDTVYERRHVFIHTICFVIGISAAFFMLAFAFSALGSFLAPWRAHITRASAIIIIVFGLLMFLGTTMGTERRFKMPEFKTMNPAIAFLMGFLFSFAWTPCVGPVLTSVLLLVANSETSGSGALFMGIYTLGFILPFLVIGHFTTPALAWLAKRRNLLTITTRVAAGILIVLGIAMFTGWLNTATSYLSRITPGQGIEAQLEQQTKNSQNEGADNQAATNADKQAQAGTDAGAKKDTPRVAAPDFTLIDQNGVEHKLSDYRGKTVFLNFWATWCPPCQAEMPDIQKLYENYGLNQNDVVVLGVANPTVSGGPRQNDESPEMVAGFLKANQYSFPVVMDTTGKTLADYRIQSFPTTYLIDPEGNIFGYVPGAISYNIMQDAVEKAKASRAD